MAHRSHKTFMPLLCRFSQNDTVQPAKVQRSTSTDPSSPKLSCIGQMKKKSTSTTTNSFLSGSLSAKPSAVLSNRYKLFNGKNIISPARISNSKCVTNRSKSCNGRGRMTPDRSKKYYVTSSDDHDIVRVVVAEELDPPLPVVKCCRRDQGVNVDLWKRRGVEIKTLQIQPVRLCMNRKGSDKHGEFALPTSATTF